MVWFRKRNLWEENYSSVDELINRLKKHRHWRNINTYTLKVIFNHLYNNSKNIPINSGFADDNWQHIKSFLMISEKYKLVENNFVPLSRTEKASNILTMFSITLERLGALIAQDYPNNNKSDEELKRLMSLAELSYQSSILCDRYLLPSYYGVIFCCSVFLDLEHALKWQGAFRVSLESLKNEDITNLNYYQRETKEDENAIAETQEGIENVIIKLTTLVEPKEKTTTGLSSQEFNQLTDLVENNHYEDAISILETIIEKDTNNEEAYLYKARVLYLQSNISGAIKLYRFIIERFKTEDAYKEIIVLLKYNYERNAQEIISLCEQMEHFEYENIPYCKLAESYTHLGKYESAVLAYNTGVRQNKKIIEEYRRNIRQPGFLRSVQDVVREYEDELYRAYCGKASVLKQLEKYEQAVACYMKAIKINTNRDSEHESYLEYESISKLYGILGDDHKASIYHKKSNALEKINDKLFYGLREDEDDFEDWYDKYVEVDADGNIINIKSIDDKE